MGLKQLCGLAVLALVFAACVAAPPPSQFQSELPYDPLAGVRAQSTLEYIAAIQTEEAVNALATRASWTATADAEYSQQTRQAAEAAYQATRVAEATAQAFSGTATAQALALSEWQVTVTVALGSLEITRQAIDLAQIEQVNAENERLSQISLDAAAARAAQETRQREIELQRAKNWSVVLPIAIILMALAGLIGTGYAVYAHWNRNRPVIVADGLSLVNRQFVDVTHAALSAPPRQLTAGAGDILEGTFSEMSLPRWEAFAAWRDPFRIPLGVDAQGQPIYIDRRRKPHLFVVGDSGTGKTTGIIPALAAHLALGMSAILINGRGADWNVFDGHPNARVVRRPAGAFDEAPRQLAAVLETLGAELERRDQILQRENVFSWPDRGQGGEILVVVDEFLTLVDLAGSDIAAGLWRALKLITFEARKYGIYFWGISGDPTQRALGRDGTTVVNKCGRVAFGLHSAAVSRAFVDCDQAVGLPVGTFVAQLDHHGPRIGRAWHPRPEQVRHYMSTRPVQVQALPLRLEAVLGEVAAEAVAEAGAPYVNGYADAIRALRQTAPALETLHDVARFLANKSSNANAAEFETAARVLAIMERAGDDWAARILNGSSSQYVDLARQHFAETGQTQPI